METEKTLFPHIPERLRGLEELAENLWWSWHPAARMVFKMLDRQVWKESGHNPDKMLRMLPPEALESAAQEADYLRHYDLVLSRFHQYLHGKAGRITNGLSAAGDRTIAYFSAEYGLHHSLPFYAGGLGFLAGDHLKECSDLRVPVVAVGFMYPEGYVYQRIREDGWQENLHQVLDRDAASISKVMDAKGEHLVIRVPFIEPPIHVAVWKIAVGRVPLYLLDTQISINEPDNRDISARLYAGDKDLRLRQEIVLGIGGAEVLQVLGIKCNALHLNEGHAAFALLEGIRDRVAEGLDYKEAAAGVGETSVFTTHTPVPAGHDVFPFGLVEKYFYSYWPALGLDRDGFIGLGVHPESPQAGFNMTALALRLAGYRNGVSQRHAELSRRMWRSLWPELSEERVPIQHVTNGIHVRTWIEPKMELLFNEFLGPRWLDEHDNPNIWEMVEEIPDDRLWKRHYWLKIKLINAIRAKARERWAKDRAGPSVVIAGGTMLDPSILTIGFARRFAAYKRADLIFHDPERLKKLLNDQRRPIQIIFAGKAHPEDDNGKRILQRVFNAASNPDMGGRIAFVEDYNEQFAQYLVHGVDVWLNNPVPPMEASGTSGMKAALNGVPNLSIMDGWWLEGFNGRNGWAFGAEKVEGNRGPVDAEAIYGLLEEEVIPAYYRMSEHGIPHDWVGIMKEAIKSNAGKFSARRMVKQYIENFYVNALKCVRPE